MKLTRSLLISCVTCTLLALFVLPGYAQPADITARAAAYQSASNVLYWKNRTPDAAYWQQDVYYSMKAAIDDSTDIVNGSLQLVYTNNSPDTLTCVFFHLYQNAFQPGAYLDDLQKHNKENAKYGKYEAQGLGTIVDHVRKDGMDLKMELDNTILKVFLNKPIAPHTAVTFDIAFKTYFDNGSTRRRMKLFMTSGFKHYDGVHWYPRMCVYDRRFGWETDQHLGREFYGDYGNFDAELTFPNNYVVEATGELQNELEVLPDSVRAKLDLKNFANKPMNSKASVVIAKDGTTKTWKYHAENVHDFAWTADPTYRIGESEWNGVRVIALAQEPVAAKWQNAAEYTARVIETYSHDFGMYIWPKIVVADARDGMEYPMLTLDGGFDPNYRSLLAHEVGHQWFFGMVGNNETYRAALDEGFTQFLTTWSVERIDGAYGVVERPKNKYQRYYTDSLSVRDGRAFLPYMSDAIVGKDESLNTHSDQFNGALGHGGGYRHVYFKTATMLYNLQYVLGDELFSNAMQHYFNKYKVCHPYFDDFRHAIIEYTHADLNWFFDEWMETTKHIDYRVASIRKGKEKDAYQVKFTRIGRMQMPIDFRVYTQTDSTMDFYIPNTWFEKPTDAKVLPRWIGWDKLKPSYTATITVPNGIKKVVIDESMRMADINMLNNSSKLPVNIRFDSRINNPVDWKRYAVFMRPDLWYNSFDGMKAGISVNGNYMRTFHVFDLSAWMNTGLAQMNIDKRELLMHDPISVRFNYASSLYKFSPNSWIRLGARSLDGLQAAYIGFEKKDPSEKNTFALRFQSMHRQSVSDATYLLYPKEWQVDRYNNTLKLSWDYQYSYQHGQGNFNAALRSSTLGSDYDYSDLTLQLINKHQLGKLDVRSRSYGRFGFGIDYANESALYLAGGSPEELMDNKYTRSRGFIDNSFLGYGSSTNHFQYGGGLNLRGYAGYLGVQETKDGNFVNIYKGSSGFSQSVELDFDRLVPLHPKAIKQYIHLDTYLFADAGVINVKRSETDLSFNNRFEFCDPRIDAGVGAVLSIKKFGPLQQVNPLNIRFDIPLFLNHTPNEAPDFVQMRWVLGINRSF